MRITLVQPPSNYEETFLLSPPLGLLSIAAAAEMEGAEVTILDFNLKGLQDQRFQTAEYFYPNAVKLIEETQPDMVGFTSMAIESHVCLETAKQLKERNKELITVFGGPHFGAIATEILEHYDWCDYVISGEGETPFQNLIRYLQGYEFALSMDNIAYRKSDEIVFKKKSQAGRDLDGLPFPAYHLVDMEEYFALNPNRLVCFEHARGCQLKCSFCYSPQHWGHGESTKSHQRIIKELVQLKAMGIAELFWVSDNLLNSKQRAIEVCNSITKSGLHFRWHCYGTLPQLTTSVLDAMSKSGCRSVFVGVDAVSEESKKTYKKAYYKSWKKLKDTLLNCLAYRIRPTCAFMLSPNDTPTSTELTLLEAAKCALLGCFVRINALTHYNGTQTRETAEKGLYSDAYARVLFDSAELLVENKYSKRNPDLFPFHQAFANLALHERFARYCRLSMQVINGHQMLTVISTLEHNIRLNQLIDSLCDSLSNTEVDCRQIGSIRTRQKYTYKLYRFLVDAGVPDDILDCDYVLTNSPWNRKELEGKGIHFSADSTCSSRHMIFRSALDLENADFTAPSVTRRYVVSINVERIRVLEISSTGADDQCLKLIFNTENILDRNYSIHNKLPIILRGI